MVGLQQYWQAVHGRICSVPGGSDEYRNFLLDESIERVLQKSLPLMVDVVSRIKHSENESYRDELQKIICGAWKFQTIRRVTEEHQSRSYNQLSFQ